MPGGLARGDTVQPFGRRLEVLVVGRAAGLAQPRREREHQPVRPEQHEVQVARGVKLAGEEA